MNEQFVLRYTSNYGEKYFLVRVAPWKLRTLFVETSPEIRDAMRFSTAPDAAQMLISADNPANWEIISAPNNPGLPGRASDLGSDRGLGVLPKTEKPPQAKS